MRKDFNASLQMGSGRATKEEEESWKSDEKDLSNITHPFSGSERNRLFLSSHGDSFLDISGVSGVDSAADGRVSVWLDFDRDGRQDLAVVNSNRPLLQLYRNETGELTTTSDADTESTESTNAGGRRNFVALRFVGGNNSAEVSSEYSNRDGYGTRVVVDTGSQQIMREHLCGQGFSGQNSSTMLIGLGEANVVDRLSVTWPSGVQQSFNDIPAGKLLVLFERSGEFTATDYQPVPNTVPLAAAQPAAMDKSSTPVLAPSELISQSTMNVTDADPSIDESKLVVVTTMASWCTSCAKHQPLLEKMSREFSRSDVSFIGFAGDPDDPAEDLEQFVERLGIHYPIVITPDDETRASVESILSSGDGADVLPSTVVLNHRGQVLKTHSGIPTVSEIRRYLQDVSAEPRE